MPHGAEISCYSELMLSFDISQFPPIILQVWISLQEFSIEFFRLRRFQIDLKGIHDDSHREQPQGERQHPGQYGPQSLGS